MLSFSAYPYNLALVLTEIELVTELLSLICKHAPIGLRENHCHGLEWVNRYVSTTTTTIASASRHRHTSTETAYTRQPRSKLPESIRLWKLWKFDFELHDSDISGMLHGFYALIQISVIC